MTAQLRLNVICDETVGLQSRSFTTPANSALTFRDFVPRLQLLTLFRDFRRIMKMCEMNYFSLFCKSYLVLFLTFIIGTPILFCTTTYLGIFWYCSRDFWSFICESPASQVQQRPNSIRGGIAEDLRKRKLVVSSLSQSNSFETAQLHQTH